MTRTRDFLRWYIRSPLGISMLLASAVGGLALGLSGLGLSMAVGSGALIFAAASAVSFVSGAGAKAAVKERLRDADSALADSLDAAARLLERIEALRIPDSDVQASAKGFSMAFGEYLDACRRERTRDPQADMAAEDVLSAVRGFLKELDGASVERRFELPDADPFPDAKERTLAYLKERTAFVRERRFSVDGGLGGRDKLSIQEELR